MISAIFLIATIPRPPLRPEVPLEIREATRNITNPRRLPLGGYTERGNKIDLPGGEPLYARVIALQQGKLRVVIESAEMLTIPNSLREAVQKKIPKDVFLLLCATHTHCAPDSQMLNSRMTFSIPGIATFKHNELAWYSQKLADAILDALRSKPQIITKVTSTSWQAPCNRPRRKFAIPDQTAYWIRFWLKSGRTTGFFWYSAHPTFYDSDEMQTRGDWPGRVNQLAYLALIGPIGDVSPVASAYKNQPGLDNAPAAAKISRFWQAMLSPLKSGHAKNRTLWERNGCLLTGEDVMSLRDPSPHPDFAKTYKIPEVLAKLLVKKFAPESGLISSISLGKLCIVGIPGEPSSAIGREIETFGHRSGFSTTLVLSHCNGWIGYILLPDDYNRGGYEALLNFYGQFEGTYVVNEADNLIRVPGSPQ